MSLASEIGVEIPFSTSSSSHAWSNNLNVAVGRKPTPLDSRRQFISPVAVGISEPNGAG